MQTSGNFNELSTAHCKSAYALQLNVKAFIEHFGIDNVGFLTLTFPDHVIDPKEAQRRFNSLRTNFLKHHYPHYIRVIERTKSGRIHYHLIVATQDNIRRGLNFAEIKAKNYRSANSNLRAHWERLREAMPKYGFGRSELLPVKTNSDGLARYVGKYIGKHIGNRILADKGIRLCQTSMGTWKAAISNFQFVSKGSQQWRAKVKKFVAKVNDFLSIKINGFIPFCLYDYSDRLADELGSQWIYFNRQSILDDLPFFNAIRKGYFV